MGHNAIPLLDMDALNAPLMDELIAAATEVIRSGEYIMGNVVSNFETDVATAIGAPHAIGVSSGTDAILAALMALDIGAGDEVITPSFTFFATAGCVARVGATPVFVDIDATTFNMDPECVESAITERTKAIMPVHLFGQSCDMGAISAIATEHSLHVIEDAAQSIGATYCGDPVGSIGDVGCFSFFPAKNLGAFGDAGLVTCKDPELAERICTIRVHGSKPKYFHHVIGGNFRLDTLQAALLSVKLPHLQRWQSMRQQNAEYYDAQLSALGIDGDKFAPPPRVFDGHVYNQYVVRSPQRDALRDHLHAANIATAIYYPRGLHQQKCFAHLGYSAGSLPVTEKSCEEVLALPVFPGITRDQQDRVVREIARFFAP